MALVDNAWYVNYGDGSTTGYYAVTQWAALTTYDCGTLRRQLATPAVGSERVFVVIVGHVASSASEPTWTTTRGGKTTDTTITWMEATGIAALNGDLSANTPTWNTVKNTAVTQGQVIQNVAGTLILIASVAGTAGNGAEPSWAAYTTAGATTADNTVTWVTLGASFGTWAAPHARLANSFAANWGQAGNKFFVGDNHAETQATSITLTSPGTLANPIFVYCVDRTVSVPPGTSDLKTTGTITSTGNSGLNFAGTTSSTYVYGLTFSGATGANANGPLSINGGSNATLILDTCAVVKGSTSGQTGIGIGANVTETYLINTTYKFGSTGDQLILANGAVIKWINTLSAIQGATIPTSLFRTGASGGVISFVGVDLSAIASGSTIFSNPGTNPFIATLTDCKVAAGVTISSTPSVPGASVDAVRVDSGATNYRNERYRYQGTQTTETTIVRTGGATDGTTAISWKIASTANSKWVLPFESQPITIWNDSTSAITTLTFYGTTTGGGVPNNDDIWAEVEYLGSASNPQGSFITTTKANNLAASTTTNNSSDGSTWGGSGAGNGFKIVVPSFTPGQKGPLNITIKVAKSSSTYYIDPKPVIT